MSTPFQQHLLVFTPLLEHELVYHLIGVNRDCKFVENIHDSRANIGQEGRSKSSRDIDVRGRPVQQKFRRTGSTQGGKHQRYHPQIVSQEELNEVEIGHVAPVVCIVQGRFAVWARYSVDVGVVIYKLICKDELIFVGRILARIRQIGLEVEWSNPILAFLQRCVLASRIPAVIYRTQVLILDSGPDCFFEFHVWCEKLIAWERLGRKRAHQSHQWPRIVMVLYVSIHVSCAFIGFI
jgi:hypothetical protein